MNGRVKADQNIRTLTVLSPWTGKACTVDTDAWDVFDLTKSGLLYHSPSELVWIKENLNSSLKVIATIPFSDFLQYQAELVAVEQKRVSDEIAAKQQLLADKVREESQRLESRKVNADSISAGNQSALLSAESRLFFLTTGSPAGEVCYVREDAKTDNNRGLAILGIYSSDTAISAEPLFSKGGTGVPVDNIDTMFQRIQQNGCGIAMGSPDELKTLMSGLKRLNREAVESLSVSYGAQETRRLVNAGAKRVQDDQRAASAEANRRQEEAISAAQRQKEEIAAAAPKQREDAAAEAEKSAADARRRHQILAAQPFTALLSCFAPGDQRESLIACFAGGSHGVDTQLEMKNGDDYKMYQPYDIIRLGPSGEQGLAILLQRSFSITAQNSS